MNNFFYSKKVVISLIFLFITLSIITLNTVYAQNISGNNIIVESGETLEKTSFLSGNNIRVDGDINGTTFVAGGNVEINGDIDGDLFIAAQTILINGTVKGSVFTASQNGSVNGNVDNNIYSAGATLKTQAKTDGNIFLAGQNITIEEEAIIKKDVFIGGNDIYQNGVINGDLNSSSEALAISGTIDGDLNYSSTNEAELSNDASVMGDTNWEKVQPKKPQPMITPFKIFTIIFSILAALVVWLVIRLFRKSFWINIADKILTKPLKTFGFGLLALFLTPILIGFLMITVIGIPLSFILLAFYIIAIYISKIIVSIFIAFWFQRKYDWSNAKVFWPFLLSLILLSILIAIPFVGWIIRFIIVGFGLGSIVLSLKKEPSINIPNS